ncbi:MAG: PQQ-binding-like beta-propeller repeat protein [Planctomycetota bacterium]
MNTPCAPSLSRFAIASRLATALSVFVALAFVSTTSADDWFQFRGNGGLSVAPGSIPKKLDESVISWKVDLPAKGASGPIVVGDRVYLTCSGGDKQDQLYTVCVDAKTGKQLWTQKFWATGRCFVHPLSANAAPTPASDGKHIFAFFSSNDLACMDLDGNLLWYRGLAVDYPKAGNDVGMSSSPVVVDGVVIVQVECQGDSFAMALDASDGTTIWKKDRPREAMWASPLLAKNNDQNFVLLQSKDGFDMFEVKTGKQVFQAEGQVSSISSAATNNGRLFVPINGTTAFAISSDGSLKQEWNNKAIRPSSMSSVVHDNKIYTLNRAGGLFVYNAADGNEVGKARVVKGSGLWATPVVVDNHMYVLAQNGSAYVVDLSDAKTPKVVSTFSFGDDEVVLGSPAVANNAMYVRSDKFLWKIAE